MEIAIRAFGSIAEITGAHFTLEGVDTVEKLKKKLVDAYPDLSNKTFMISVDKKIATKENILPNSSVALLPPFSGG